MQRCRSLDGESCLSLCKYRYYQAGICSGVYIYTLILHCIGAEIASYS